MQVARAPGEGGIELAEGEGRLRLCAGERLEIRQRGRFGGLEARKRMWHGQKIQQKQQLYSSCIAKVRLLYNFSDGCKTDP